MTTRWSARFDDPIPLATGGQLTSLRDAAAYIVALPSAEQENPAWQLAGQTLLAAAEGRDFVMHARIAMIRALNRGRPAPVRARKPSLGDRWRAAKGQ